MKTSSSRKLFERAQELMPGGVSSPVRAFNAVSGTPPVIARAQGARIHDLDDNQFIDYMCNWGTQITGHAHPHVIAAIKEAADRGVSYGAPTRSEIELAEIICKSIPSLDFIRFVNSGTEAAMSALRLARAYTKREKIIKFAGCYHGHADLLLAKAGSGIATLGIPGSAGITASTVKDTCILKYNDLTMVEAIFENCNDDIAAVIVEPIAGNMGVVPPKPGFLKGLRKITKKHGSILIFDEIITGFRVAYGGAQKLYGINPDLTCLGKIIGGGLPVGAYGGRSEIMQLISPLGKVYQAGTLSGNPIAMNAGIATLNLLTNSNSYQYLDQLSNRFANGLIQLANEANISLKINRVGSMMTPFFAKNSPSDYDTSAKSNLKQFSTFFHAMLNGGVYLPPSQFEAWFTSLAHTRSDVDQTLKVATDAFNLLGVKRKTLE